MLLIIYNNLQEVDKKMEKYKRKFEENSKQDKVIEWLIETSKGDEQRIEYLFKEARISSSQINTMYEEIKDGGGFD